MSGWLLAIIQSLLYIALAPLLAGWVRLLRARLQGRCGPPPWQTYRDLARLVHRPPRVPQSASGLFQLAPAVVFTATWLAAATVPLMALDLPTARMADIIVLVGLLGLARTFMALAAMDTGTAFGGMGAGREMLVAAFAEPAMLMAVFTLTMTAHSTDLATVMTHHLTAGLLLRPSYLFALGALVLVALAECGRLPVDNPSTHLELTMIHEAMLLEYSGRHLALMHWAGQIRLLLYAVLIINIFLPWGIARAVAPGALAVGAAVIMLKLAAFGLALALAETVLAKMRLFRVPTFLNLALLLGLLGLLSHVILEVGA